MRCGAHPLAYPINLTSTLLGKPSLALGQLLLSFMTVLYDKGEFCIMAINCGPRLWNGEGYHSVVKYPVLLAKIMPMSTYISFGISSDDIFVKSRVGGPSDEGSQPKLKNGGEG